MTKFALGILVVLIGLQVAAWGAVTVSWTDSIGSHVESLSILWNPEYDGMPYSLEKKYAWQGAINVTMDTMGPIKFTVAGNFWGGPGFDYGIWYQVKIDQYVLNNTGRGWSGFNLWTENLSPDPNPARNPTFYTTFSYDPADWWSDILPGGMQQQYYAENPALGPYVVPGGTFYDLCKVNADVVNPDGTQPSDGDGGFYLYKQAVPEPGSLAAVAGCLAGLLAFTRRRKA